MNKEYLCTRPTLAQQLISKGFEYKKTVNPWDGKRISWSFTASSELLKIVADYYTAHSLPIPAVVTRLENELDG